MLKYIHSKPLLSTIFAAVVLSSCWTTFWLLVFCISTWVLGYSTAQPAFILAFWLSVAAEAFIRWAENTDFVAKYSKPNEPSPQGDNQDFRLPKASICLLSLLLLAASYLFLARQIPEIFGLRGPDFVGQSANNLEGFKSMLINWWQRFITPGISISLATGFLFRVIIYKRSHK